jgi:hypothetical protein
MKYFRIILLLASFFAVIGENNAWSAESEHPLSIVPDRSPPRKAPRKKRFYREFCNILYYKFIYVSIFNDLHVKFLV